MDRVRESGVDCVHEEGAGGICARRAGGCDDAVAIGRSQLSHCCCRHVTVVRVMMCGPGRDQGEGKGRARARGGGVHKAPVVWAVLRMLGWHVMAPVHVR